MILQTSWQKDDLKQEGAEAPRAGEDALHPDSAQGTSALSSQRLLPPGTNYFFYFFVIVGWESQRNTPEEK